MQLTTLILNRTNGAVLATINLGGGDQVVYDPSLNRYYVAASRWTASGLSSGPRALLRRLARRCSGSSMPIGNPQSGNNAHSVMVDATTHQIYMPYSSAAAPAGCSTCSNVPDGGVLVFAQ